jgi:hypothetical protein
MLGFFSENETRQTQNRYNFYFGGIGSHPKSRISWPVSPLLTRPYRSGTMSKRDWKNPKDYAFVETLSVNRLAWEFLRRNPEYRADWARELPRYLEREKESRKNPRFKNDPVHKAPLISIDDPMFTVNPHIWDYFHKWGLYELVNPDQDAPFFLHFDRSYGGIETGYGEKSVNGPTAIPHERRNAFFPLPKGKAKVIFDLELPLKPQIDKVFKDLLHKQEFLQSEGIINLEKPRVRPDREDFTCLLRVLDAKAAKATIRRIAYIIFPNYDNEYPDYTGNRKVKDTLKTARRFMRTDYRKLVIHYPP